MTKFLELDTFLKIPGCILDVRSPGEFLQGRLPDAHNLPLFSNEERASVGTLYKQVGRKEAVILGMQFAAPKFAFFIEQIEKKLAAYPLGALAKIHCWRGGMRSSSIAMLIEMAGIQSVTLQGGYKAYRRWVLQFLNQPLNLRVLGGMTGCGKTAILESLRQKGQQVLDLEKLACHRGSSFGMLGLSQQPSNEQFENDIAFTLSKFDLNKPIWIEDESRRIGTCKIPDSLYISMSSSPLYIIERPVEERLANIQHTYWTYGLDRLKKATERLCKKLGLERTKEIIFAIENNDFQTATLKILEYYDKSYLYGMQKHKRQSFILKATNRSNEEWACDLIDWMESTRQ